MSLTAGAQAIQMNPLPAGIIQAYSINRHYVLINGVEHLITNMDQANRVIVVSSTVTATNPVISSATAGIQEAHYDTLVTFDADQTNLGYPRGIRVPSGSFVVSQTFICLKTENVEGQFSIRGESMWTTTLIARNQNQNFFLWANNFVPNPNISGQSYLKFSEMRFKNFSGMTLQTGGAAISVYGHCRVEVENCNFYLLYDCVYCWGYSIMLRCTGLFGQGINRHLIYIAGNQADGPAGNENYASTFEIQYCYCDAAFSPATIRIIGGLGGGTMSNMWLQSADCTIRINSRASRSTNEICITGCILDQDRDSTIADVIIEDEEGIPALSSNCVKLSANFISSPKYAIWMRRYEHVQITDNFIKVYTTLTPILITDCNYTNIMDNQMIDIAGGVPQFIGIVNTATSYGKAVVVKGNVANTISGANIPAFIGLDFQASPIGPIVITENTAMGCTVLCNPYSSTSADRAKVFLRRNTVPNYAVNSIPSASTISIPWDDDETVGVITGGGTISRILGGQVGMRRLFLVGASGLNFAIGGAAPGDIVEGLTISVNKGFWLVYYPPTGKWYFA
jgi:hypothetical protein